MWLFLWGTQNFSNHILLFRWSLIKCLLANWHLTKEQFFFFFLKASQLRGYSLFMHGLSKEISLIRILRMAFFYIMWKNFSLSLNNLKSKLIYFYILLLHFSHDNQYCLAMKMLRSKLHHIRVEGVYSCQSI